MNNSQWVLILCRVDANDNDTITMVKYETFQKAFDKLMRKYWRVIYPPVDCERIAEHLIGGRSLCSNKNKDGWVYYTIQKFNGELNIFHTLNKKRALTVDQLLDTYKF